MAVLQAAAAALIALIIAPGLFFYFDVTPKLVVLFCAAGACLALLPWTPVGRAGRRFGLLTAFGLLSLAISTALSANPALSLFGTNWRRFGAASHGAVLLLAWMTVVTMAGRVDRVRLILRALVGATGLMSVYGIAQYFGVDPILPAAAYHVGEGIWTIVRPPGTLGYVSYFATWLGGAAFLCLALAEFEEARWLRWTARACAALALLAMLLTGTRAALLGVVAGGVVWLVKRGFRPSRRIAAAAMLPVVALTAFYFSPLGWPLRSRTRWFREDAWGGARPLLWRDSLRMGMERLPAGYGPEVFTATFPRFESLALARAYPDFAHESPHNIFLDAFLAQGLVGLLLLGAFCWAGFRGPNAGIVAALAAIVVSQQFTVFTAPTALLFYITAALSVALTPGAAEEPRKFRLAWLAIPAAAVLVYCGIRLGLADAALASAQGNLAAGRLPESTASYDRYLRLRFPGSSSGMWYSRALLNARAFPQADAPSLDATRFAEDPFNAFYNRALVCAAREDGTCVEQSLRAAIAAHPGWFKPHWTLAQYLRLQARMEEAETEAARAADLNHGANAEVARTLEEIRTRRAALGSSPLQ